jgi:hypothetical protein
MVDNTLAALDVSTLVPEAATCRKCVRVGRKGYRIRKNIELSRIQVPTRWQGKPLAPKLAKRCQMVIFLGKI